MYTPTPSQGLPSSSWYELLDGLAGRHGRRTSSGGRLASREARVRDTIGSVRAGNVTSLGSEHGEAVRVGLEILDRLADRLAVGVEHGVEVLGVIERHLRAR